MDAAACRVVLTVMVNSFAWLPSETALGQAVKPLLTQVYMQVVLVHPICPGSLSHLPLRACCLACQFAKWLPIIHSQLATGCISGPLLAGRLSTMPPAPQIALLQ